MEFLEKIPKEILKSSQKNSWRNAQKISQRILQGTRREIPEVIAGGLRNKLLEELPEQYIQGTPGEILEKNREGTTGRIP